MSNRPSVQSIGILSPSSSIQRERFDTGLSVLKTHGFNVTIHPQTYLGADTGNQYAGSDAQKAAAFMELWSDNSIDAVMASCGGNFSAQFLHLLDFKKIAETPKTLIGFSDTTSLLSALYAQMGIGGIFGPTVQTLGRIGDLDKVVDGIRGYTANTHIDMSRAVLLNGITTSAKAPLYAATLSVLLSLAGTPYFPNLTGHILMIEDIGEELSHLDRMLWQLDQLCPLNSLAGLIFGEMVDIKDTGRPLGLGFEAILQKFANELNTPLIMNAPFGHSTHFMPIPIGRLATIDFSSSPSLILD